MCGFVKLIPFLSRGGGVDCKEHRGRKDLTQLEYRLVSLENEYIVGQGLRE